MKQSKSSVAVVAVVLIATACGGGAEELDLSDAAGGAEVETVEAARPDDLPKGFPADVPVPAGFQVTLAMPSPGRFEMHGSVRDRDPAAVFADLAADLEASGWDTEVLEGEPYGFAINAERGEDVYQAQLNNHDVDLRLVTMILRVKIA